MRSVLPIVFTSFVCLSTFQPARAECVRSKVMGGMMIAASVPFFFTGAGSLAYAAWGGAKTFDPHYVSTCNYCCPNDAVNLTGCVLRKNWCCIPDPYLCRVNQSLASWDGLALNWIDSYNYPPNYGCSFSKQDTIIYQTSIAAIPITLVAWGIGGALLGCGLSYRSEGDGVQKHEE